MLTVNHRIVVVLDTKVYVYNFADLQLLYQIETCKNPKGNYYLFALNNIIVFNTFINYLTIYHLGLCSLSPSNSNVLAVPGIKPGSVHIENYDLKTTQIIHAHTK